MSETPNGFKKNLYYLAPAAFLCGFAYVAHKLTLQNRMKLKHRSPLHVIHRVLDDVSWHLWNLCPFSYYVIIYAFFHSALIIFCWTNVYSNFTYFISCAKYVFKDNMLMSPKREAEALDKIRVKYEESWQIFFFLLCFVYIHVS